jgi:hypothetical protein
MPKQLFRKFYNVHSNSAHLTFVKRGGNAGYKSAEGGWFDQVEPFTHPAQPAICPFLPAFGHSMVFFWSFRDINGLANNECPF